MKQQFRMGSRDVVGDEGELICARDNQVAGLKELRLRYRNAHSAWNSTLDPSDCLKPPTTDSAQWASSGQQLILGTPETSVDWFWEQVPTTREVKEVA